MSGSRRSLGPVRQLSLQQPAPRRQQIRRQRSAEDDTTLQIYANPIARGKHGSNGKSGAERPKVRVAWGETRRKSENQIEQVEVVARQIPGRSRPTTGKSRGFIGIEKPSILYSRQELAERLRLAWKHREENKANLDIFLAHSTLEERCDSEMSYATITTPSSPLPQKDTTKLENFLDDDQQITQNDREEEEHDVDKTMVLLIKNDSGSSNVEKNGEHETPFEHFCIRKIHEDKSAEKFEKNTEVEKEEQDVDNGETCDDANENFFESRKRTLISIDCANLHIQSTALPSIKFENASPRAPRSTKEDFSSARQKRASFQSGTNRAFLGPIKSPPECRCDLIGDKTALKSNAMVEKTAPTRSTTESKDNPLNDRTAPRGSLEDKNNLMSDKNILQRPISDIKLHLLIDKNPRTGSIVESKDAFVDDKIEDFKNVDITCGSNKGLPLNVLQNKSNLIIQKNVPQVVECKDNNLASDQISLPRSTSELRCNLLTDKFVTLKSKTIEIQKVDLKSRRTNSAPPQRHVENAVPGNRLQVNIVIDTPGTLGSDGRPSVYNFQEKSDADQKDDVADAIDANSPKVSCGRSVRSAPLKRRSKSAKRRFWAAGSCKNDEDGKSRNRSSSRGKSAIDSKAIDVVTMVSLVSSADSDSDVDNSPGDDKLINELRSKLPTTSIIKTSVNPAINISRKPIKSVSFQRDSFDEDLAKEQQVPAKEEKKTIQARFAIVNNRGNGANLSSGEETVSWRTDIPGLALPVLALIHDPEETLDVPLTDREKRCLAVPIGDLHDKKRKLLRTRSTPSRSVMERQTMSVETKEQESPTVLPRTEIPAQTKIPIENSTAKTEELSAIPVKEADQETRLMPSEPHFQTNKEKECWHLYRRMCDKGVYVSFDTVLRGMLTPTEYRLRQKDLLQDL